MLEVSGLASAYGRIPIINGVSLGVAEGELLGVLGHNGAGKSTLLKTLIGFNEAAAGSVVFDGHDITRLPVHRRAKLGLGYVPQGRQIFPSLSVRENLLIATARSHRTVDELLARFPRLVRLLDRPGGALSGGEQQLLALARCLGTAPRLVLLDEPTEGIQPSIIEEMIEALKAINREEKLAIVLVEQNLEFLAHLAERILILKRGAVAREFRGSTVHDMQALAEIMM